MSLTRAGHRVEKLVCLLRPPQQTKAAVVLCFDFCNLNEVHEVIAKFQQEFIITCPNSSEGYKISESPNWTLVGKE